MLQRIMVALDGSPLAEQVVPFAAALAGAFDAELILLRVVEPTHGASHGFQDSFDWRLDRAEALEYLSAIKSELQDQGLRVDIDVTSGRASEEILEIARAREVDLVVLGSHGTSGLTQFRMASTAHKVVSGSNRSVLVVPACESVPEGPAFTSILVAVDGSPHSDWAAALAARLARAQGAELTVLHVVKSPTLLDPQGTAREKQIVEELIAMNCRAAARYLGGLRRKLECPGMVVQTDVEVAEEVAPALCRHAAAAHRPLIVLGAKGDSGTDSGLNGGLITVMIAKTQQPILVLREPNHEDRPNRSWRRSTASAPQRQATIRS